MQEEFSLPEIPNTAAAKLFVDKNLPITAAITQ